MRRGKMVFYSWREGERVPFNNEEMETVATKLCSLISNGKPVKEAVAESGADKYVDWYDEMRIYLIEKKDSGIDAITIFVLEGEEMATKIIRDYARVMEHDSVWKVSKEVIGNDAIAWGFCGGVKLEVGRTMDGLELMRRIIDFADYMIAVKDLGDGISSEYVSYLCIPQFEHWTYEITKSIVRIENFYEEDGQILREFIELRRCR